MDLNKANEKMHNLSNSWKLRWTSALGTFALAFGILVVIALSPVKADHNTGSDTDIENEFEGHITIELSNSTPNRCKIYSGEGIAQFLFLKGNEQPETSYKSRKGKYQGQTGVTLAKIK